MQIETLQIKNYRALRDVRLSGLTGRSVFVGANGTGKSTLFDVFGFLQDSLVHNVRQALAKRGGFKEVVSRGSTDPIEISLKFRQDAASPGDVIFLQVALDEKGSPVVEREVLKYRRGQYGQPWHFLDFKRGHGSAVINEKEYARPDAKEEREEQHLDEPDILAVKGLRSVPALRSCLRVSEAHRELARLGLPHQRTQAGSQEAGLAEHLSPRGDNLPLVAQYLFERHPDIFREVLAKMAQRVPGVSKVEAVTTEDGRLVLKFQDGAFKDPFIARYVSDGTIKMFAYLLLLHDPKPHPLLCVEEPENQLYPDFLRELAEEFRRGTSCGGSLRFPRTPPLIERAQA